MADDFSMVTITAPFKAALDDANRVSDKATMFALRSLGRFTGRAAKAKAPVYRGTDPRAQAESGNLKKSIKNSKRLTQVGHTFSMKVGPFGSKKAGTSVTRHGTGQGQLRGVQLYRASQESIYGYMAAGVGEAGSGGREIFEAAYARAFARFS